MARHKVDGAAEIFQRDIRKVRGHARHPEICQRQDRIAAAREEGRLVLGKAAARSRHDDDARARSALMIEERRDQSAIANLDATHAASHQASRDFDRCGFRSLLGRNRDQHRSRRRLDERLAFRDGRVETHRPKQTHRIFAGVGARLRGLPAKLNDTRGIRNEDRMRFPSPVQIVQRGSAHDYRCARRTIAYADGDGLIVESVSSIGFDAHAIW